MFWGVHTRSFFFSLSCLLFVLVHCSSFRPVPCRMHFELPLPTSCPLLFCLFGARTQAPTPTHAICHHSHLPCFYSFCTLAARLFFLCVSTCRHRGERRGELATCIPAYGVRLPIVSFFFFRSWPLCFFWRRPSLGVLASCIHGMLCYLFIRSWTLCFLRRPRVSVSYCLLGGTRYLLVGVRTLCFSRRPRVSVFA